MNMWELIDEKAAVVDVYGYNLPALKSVEIREFAYMSECPHVLCLTLCTEELPSILPKEWEKHGIKSLTLLIDFCEDIKYMIFGKEINFNKRYQVRISRWQDRLKLTEFIDSKGQTVLSVIARNIKVRGVFYTSDDAPSGFKCDSEKWNLICLKDAVVALYGKDNLPKFENVKIEDFFCKENNGKECSLVLTTGELPPVLPQKWRDRNVNAVRFFIDFFEVVTLISDMEILGDSTYKINISGYTDGMKRMEILDKQGNTSALFFSRDILMKGIVGCHK